MKRMTVILAVALAACSAQSPADKQADAIKDQAHSQAELITQRADDEAAGLLNSSAALGNQAKQVGGFTGDRLQEQSDSLRRQAEIVKRQGRAQADAIETQAEGQAKAIRSQ